MAAVIVDDSEFDFAISLLDHRRLHAISINSAVPRSRDQTFSGKGTTLGASFVADRSGVGDSEALKRFEVESSSAESSALRFVAGSMVSFGLLYGSDEKRTQSERQTTASLVA